MTENHSASVFTVPAGDSLAGKTVLLVEDEGFIADLLVNWLGRLGVKALLARNGTEGLRLLAENPGRVCAVIADLRLPDMRGDNMCARLREMHPRLPVLLSSGRYQSEAEEMLGRTGPTCFMQKPYPLEEVVEKLQKLLAAA